MTFPPPPEKGVETPLRQRAGEYLAHFFLKKKTLMPEGTGNSWTLSGVATMVESDPCVCVCVCGVCVCVLCVCVWGGFND